MIPRLYHEGWQILERGFVTEGVHSRAWSSIVPSANQTGRLGAFDNTHSPGLSSHHLGGFPFTLPFPLGNALRGISLFPI
jgi:hypothetical protein